MFRYLLLPVITQKTFMTIKNLLLSQYIGILAHSAQITHTITQIRHILFNKYQFLIHVYKL